MNTAPANSGQVEKVLEDLIRRLTSKESTPEIKAALIEAKRLRTVTNRWGAIPPPPDARREMLSRVMELISQLGGALSGPPAASSISDAPPPPARSAPVPKSASDAMRARSVSTRPPPNSQKNRSPQAYKATELGLDRIGESPVSDRPATLRADDLESIPAALSNPAAASWRPGRGSTPIPSTSRSRPPDGLDEIPIPTPRSPSGRPTPPTSQPSPLRGRTITGRPSAATDSGAPASGRTARPRIGTMMGLDPEPDDERKSSYPTAPPPPGPRGAALGAITPSQPAPAEKRRSSAQGNKSWPRRETMAMGSVGVTAALEALGDRAPADSDRVGRSGGERHTARTTPPPGPTAAVRAQAPSPAPIRAVGNHRAGALEGLSSSVSSSETRAPENDGRLSPGRTMQFTPAPSPTRTSEAPGKPWRTVVSPGIAIVRPDMAAWQAHPVAEGITIKLLYRDPRSGVYSALLRLSRGAMLPRRKHVAPEEFLVVSGVAKMGDVEISAGEYCRAEAQTTHEPITTDSGCTLFLCGSEHDEFLLDP